MLAKPVGADETTGELGAGPFVQQGGTLRYAGPADGVWTRAVTNTASTSTGAVVWQIDNDLTMDCDVAQTVGAFVKTGPGTLSFTTNFNFGGSTAVADGTRRKVMDLSPDRAPTQGHSNFTVVDGTVVIDTAPGSTAISGPVTNVLTAKGICTIGACTTLDGAETTGVLEHRSGITRTTSSLTLGFCNGSTHNSSTPLSPTLRMTGGRLILGLGTTNAIYMGVNQNVSTFTDPCSTPRLEVSSAQRLICKHLHVGYTPGVHSTVIVRDGGYLYNLDGHVYVGNYAKYTNPIPTTNYIEVTGEGSWMSFQNFYNDNKTNGMVTTFRIADGGTVEMRNFVNRVGGADRPRGELHLIVDGGIWRHRNNNNATPHIPSTMTSVKVGPGGFITYFNGGSEDYPVIFEKGIEPLDDSGTDGGLHVTQGSKNMPPLRLNAVNTYCGPTEITFTRVYLGKQGKLPSGTALTISKNEGGLIITNGVQTVGSFTFGYDLTSYGPILGFGPGSRLDVTGETHVGAIISKPKLYLFETEGGTSGLKTAGTYTYLTARAEDVHDLQLLAGQFTFPLKPDDVDYTCFVDVEGERALLKVTVTPAGTPAATGDSLIVPSDPATTNTPTAADVAAARAIFTNPAYADCGTVELGALTGFGAGGTLTAWNGFTRVSDLSFMRSETNLVLGMGTLVYTGASAEIPGLTIDTASERSSVLDIAETNTTLTIRSLNAVRGSLSKMGPGTLHLAGTGTITLPHNAKDNGSYNGRTATGIGPGTGFRYFNVNEGKLAIGTVGDPTDAPMVISTGDFSVGSQSHRIGQGVQTTGELEMNNGALTVSSYFYLGYYSGRYSDCPDIHLYPTVTQNGGEISYSTLRMGHANATYYQTASPNLFIHGGTNTCRGTAAFGYSVVPTAGVYRATVRIDGTGVMRVGTNAGCGWVDKAAGVDLTVSDNGRLEVSNTLYLAYANKRETNTFHLCGNGTIRSRSLSGNGMSYGLNAYFDGGTYESLVNAKENSVLENIQHAYIGAGGFNIDLSHQSELAGPTTYWLVIRQAFEPDPDLGGAPDGGLTFSGAGTVSFGAGFQDSTFTGGIRLRDGARALMASGNSADFSFDAAPGTRLFDYSGANNVVKDLTLGEAGATEPVFLELCRNAPTQGFVVTNSLSILSPVAITTHDDTHDLSPVVAAGTYTALVYSASCADVDLSKFTLPADAPQTATLSAEQVTVDGGDYDGMKAVVVTIAVESVPVPVVGNVWTSVTAGGNWSDAQNWEDTVAGAPNGAQQVATFNPATKAGVAVTLDEAVTLGGLTFTEASNAKYGYTLSGQGLTLDNGAETAVVANAKGTNVIASAVTLASDAQVQTDIGNELRLTGDVSGAGNLNVNTHVVSNAGHVVLSVSPGYMGKVKTGSGRVVMDDLSFIKAPDQLMIGLGTLLYTGPDVSIPGFSMTAISGRPAVFQSNSDVTVDALTVSGTSAFLKLGNGTLHLNGTGTFAPNTSRSYATPLVMYGNGDSPYGANRGMTVASGTFVMGEVDDPANAPTINITSGDLGIGTPTSTKNGSATFELNNGTLSIKNTLYLSYYSTSGNKLTFRQNGGSLVSAAHLRCTYNGSTKSSLNLQTLFEMNAGTAYFAQDLLLGMGNAANPSSYVSRVVVNGGTLAFGGNASFADHYQLTTGTPHASVVELNGGLFAVTGTVNFAKTAGSVGTLRLNPGATFRAGAVTQTVATATTAFYGNGGAFQPIAATAAGRLMNANFSLYASTNGLVVDTSEMASGASFTIQQPILHDPDCDGADGGLVKRGAALLTLAGANTYTGPTVVEGGMLAVSGTGTLGAGGGLAVARGAICDLGGTAQAVGDVVASGLVRNGTLTVGGAVCATADDVLAVYGDLAIANTAAVDFAAVPNADLAAGVPLAVVSGTATLPSRVRALNAGTVRSVALKQVDNVVYAVLAPNGTMVIVR